MRIPILATATLSALLVAAPHAGGDEPKADKARTVAGGTRFPAEACCDEKGIRELLQAQREDQANFDQIRRIQGTDRSP
jgi:hypothetical protein